MLLLSRLALRVLSPARIFAWADRPLRHINRFAAGEVSWISWAIETASAGRWMKASCLAQALAAHAMLRRRGISNRVCLGVNRNSDRLAAHAWIEVEDDKVIGGAEAAAFTPIAAFGGLV
jgi:Transglutaminase-like superfamily